MTIVGCTHEELATKENVDERFDNLEQCMKNPESAFTSNMAELDRAIASLNDILARLTKFEEGQRQIICILERIERQTSRDEIGF